jgi:hypothetical protein
MFSMKITDLFPMPDQGTVVVGIVADGSVAVGDALSVHTADGPVSVTVGAIESDGQSRPGADVDETVNLLLRGESLEQIRRGQILTGATTAAAPTAKPPEPQRVCPKCEGNMVEGFVGDHSHGNLLVARWMAGKPRPGIFWEVDPTGVETRKVATFRCVGCGYLESYAAERVQ